MSFLFDSSQHSHGLFSYLYRQHRVVAPVLLFGGRLYVRILCMPFVAAADVERLLDAIEALCALSAPSTKFVLLDDVKFEF